MTLDEAIKHCEEVANREAENAEWLNLGDDSSAMFREKSEKCRECAEEHRQLAEWLKDYKRLKEQEPCADAIDRQQLMGCVWIKFDTEKDKNRFIHLVRDIAPLVIPQEPTDKSHLEKICEELAAENDDLRDQLAMRDRFQKKEPCGDCISRKDTCAAIIRRLGIKDESFLLEAERVIYQQILAMPSVTPQPKMGCVGCVYEKTGNNSTYPCSHCSRCYTDKYKEEKGE